MELSIITNNNPNQLTVGQLMNALGQCDRDDLVKFYDTDAVSLNDVAFVERYATGGTVYLYSEKSDLDNFFSPAGLDENADPVIEIVRSKKNFVETTWQKFIQTDRQNNENHVCPY